MPCRTAHHPTDSDVYVVDLTRKEVPKMLRMIQYLETRMDEKSALAEYVSEIQDLMKIDPEIRLVSVVGFGPESQPGQDLNITRNRDLGRLYGQLADLVTREMCRLCSLSERKPGKILGLSEQRWWREHRMSSGHVECPTPEPKQ